MTHYYAAPLEGITTHVWRNAHRRMFGGADRYFTPFFSPTSNLTFQAKDLRELTQGEADLVPQILTNRSDLFLWAARELQTMGFSEVNLNLGCPSGTVVAKHKGSGMLRDPASLDAMLDEIFTALPDLRISVKARIGLKDSAEWPVLLDIFSRYPICELTVHPRLQCQYYNGTADRQLFLQTTERTSLPLVYNGDVCSPDDPVFSYGCGVMVGRGLIANPALLRQVRGGKAATREELTEFHHLLVEGYRSYMPGDLPLLHRMWEFWHYFADAFENTDAALKKMHKAKKISDYNAAANSILEGCILK